MKDELTDTYHGLKQISFKGITFKIPDTWNLESDAGNTQGYFSDNAVGVYVTYFEMENFKDFSEKELIKLIGQATVQDWDFIDGDYVHVGEDSTEAYMGIKAKDMNGESIH